MRGFEQFGDLGAGGHYSPNRLGCVGWHRGRIAVLDRWRGFSVPQCALRHDLLFGKLVHVENVVGFQCPGESFARLNPALNVSNHKPQVLNRVPHENPVVDGEDPGIRHRELALGRADETAVFLVNGFDLRGLMVWHNFNGLFKG